MCENRLQNPVAILQHLVVPEPKDFPPVTLKIGVANSVARAFGVLRPVGFGDQLSANTKKVDDVRAYRDLPAKLESAEATIAQKTPQAQLGVGRRAAHCSGARALVRRDACVGLHRSSIGPAALIRRAFSAPPSPGGRRGAGGAIWRIFLHGGKAPFSAPSPLGRRWREAPDEGACITTS